MPTYEYECPEGHAFERIQKISGKPRAKCPTCGKAASRKISGGAGLVFKGSGFYITDYGKDGKGVRKSEAASESTSESRVTESKTEQKPEAKAPSKEESGSGPRPEKAPGQKAKE